MLVKLRPIMVYDLDLLLAWAQVPEVWKYLPTSRKNEKLTWEDHYSWWKDWVSAQGGPYPPRRDWAILYSDMSTVARRVGVAHAVFNYPNPPEIGLYIGEMGVWGKGIGKLALEEMIKILSNSGYRIYRAVIHPKNRRSISLFTSLGFRRMGKGRNGQDLYEANYSTSVRPTSPVPIAKERDRLSCKFSPA